VKKSINLLISLLFVSTIIIGCSSDKVDKNDKNTSENNEIEDDRTNNNIDGDANDSNENTNVSNEADDEENNMQSKEEDYEVHLGGEMVETKNGIIIEGESNLLPGSRVTGEVKVVDKNVSMYLFDSTEELDFSQDATEVVEDDGSFHLELEHPNMDKETVVSVKFSLLEEQDDEILDHYGEHGEKLEGPFIYKHINTEDGIDLNTVYQKAEVMTTFTPKEDNKAIRHFKEPNWHEKPDDIGDPEVWIEIDEVNNDDDYQYIRGRSNLIEGSRIMLKPGLMKVAETMIQKDGSFYFKYDYKDSDSTLIVFDSSDHQWGIVEDTYGKKGQKLEGEWAGSDITEKKQIIEYEVELKETEEIEVPDNVDIEMNDSEITLLIPEDILFGFDKYKLKDDSKKTLQEIGGLLTDSFNKDDYTVEIEGHTDNEGDDQYNQELSEKRADEVKKYFENQLKETDVSFITKGYGSRKPVASNDTESGQAKNRRVEIVINMK